MTMRLKLYTLLCISFLLIFTACNQDDDPVPAEKVTRTVLAYIMADNSLSGFASIDIDEMMKGMEAVDASLYNLLVYVDDASREGSQSYKFPTLYRLSKDKNGNVVKETVKEYKEQVSTDPAVMQEVRLVSCSRHYYFIYGQASGNARAVFGRLRQSCHSPNAGYRKE